MFPEGAPANLETLDAFPHEIVDEPTLWVPLSDGTRLAARLWRPADAERNPVPAILEYIPYRRRDGRLGVDERIHPFFAGHGFAALRVDIRGSGDSGGLLADEYLKLEQDDAVELIEWIAAQPWCDGRVGMMGLSWGGFSSLQVAARRPGPLKAIVALGATVDRYNDDVHYKNGCLLNENFGWASSFLSFQTRPPDPEVLGVGWRETWLHRLENLAFFAETWFAHPARDDYWKHGSVCEDYGAIEVPVMIVTGWGDLYVNAVPRLLENLKGPCRGLTGAWAHEFPHLATPGPAIDFLGEALAWWRQWLKDEDQGLAPALTHAPATLAFCQQGAAPDPFAPEVPGRWLSAPHWPAPDAGEVVFHLGDSGLSESPGRTSARAFRSPLDTGTASGELVPHCLGPEMPQDQRPDDGKSLLFDTPVLEEAIDIWGDPVVEIALASNRPSGNLIVRLCDVGPDGASERVTFGCLNLMHRDGNENPLPMPLDAPVPIRLSLDHVAHRFPAGHRLRLALSTACWPNIWPAPDDPTLTLAGGPARLVLPIPPAGAEDPGRLAAPPRAPKPANTKVQRPAGNERRVVTDQGEKTTTLEIRDDYGALVYTDHAMMNAGLKQERYTIAWDDPLSATADYAWTHELGRGPWQVRTETVTRLTCDAGQFHLEARVTAFEGDAQVFEKTWRKSLPRG